jgi:hypothetical protein
MFLFSTRIVDDGRPNVIMTKSIQNGQIAEEDIYRVSLSTLCFCSYIIHRTCLTAAAVLGPAGLVQLAPLLLLSAVLLLQTASD